MRGDLAREEVPRKAVDVVQVDERVAPIPLRSELIHAMPVESTDLEAAAARYVVILHPIAGSQPVFPVLKANDADAAGRKFTRAGDARS
jgi:hypothetical protein